MELQTYTVDAAAIGELVDAWNRTAVTVLNQLGIRVVGAWVIEGADRFLTLIEAPKSLGLEAAARAVARCLPPGVSVTREPVIDALQSARPPRRLTRENRALASPRPVPWKRIEASPDERVLWVTYMRGAGSDLHHIDVGTFPDHVEVTVYLGSVPTPGRAQRPNEPRPIAAVAIEGCAAVHLPEPLGGRAVMDGASRGDVERSE